MEVGMEVAKNCILESLKGGSKRDLHFHVALSSYTLGVVIFRRGGFIIYGGRGCAVEASVYSLCGGVTPLYVKCGII